MKKQPFKISYKGSSLLQFTKEEERQCYFYEVKEKVYEDQSSHHHLILLGMTESMGMALETVKKSLKKILQEVRRSENQYISLLCFGRHNTVSDTLQSLKADLEVYRQQKVYKKIEQEIDIKKGCVLSEALAYARKIIDGFTEGVNVIHHIYFIIDEESISKDWSLQEEMRRCYELAAAFKVQGISLDGIGVGKFYYRPFLMKLTEVSEGKLLHAENAEKIKKMAVQLIHQRIENSCQMLVVTNADFFITSNCRAYQNEGEKITIGGLNKTSLLITYDEPLIISGNKTRRIERKVSEAVKEEFLYHLAAYKLKQGKVDESCFILKELGDISAYKRILNSYSMIEQARALNYLYALAENPQIRYKKGKKEGNNEEEEPLCLLEILRMMMDDPETQLLWDYGIKYEYSGIKKKPQRGYYEMIRPDRGFGRVEKILIGEKKLNIGLQVKIEGQVEEIETHLKLDACLYREYHLVVNGNIKIDTLHCMLSRSLKKKLRREKLIKQSFRYGEQEIYLINLRNLKVVNQRVKNSLPLDKMIRTLYEIEAIKVREKMIGHLIAFLSQKTEVRQKENVSMKEEQIRNRYGINHKGVFTSVGKDDLDIPYKVYRASILEWKLEKFPSSEVEQAALTYYKSYLTNNPIEDYLRLEAELKILKYTRYMEEMKVQCARITYGILKEEICQWDEVIYRDKIQFDRLLGTNTIIDEQKLVCKKDIEEFIFKEEKYETLIKYSLTV